MTQGCLQYSGPVSACDATVSCSVFINKRSTPSDTDGKSTQLRFAMPVCPGDPLLNVFQNLDACRQGQAWRAEDAINDHCGRSRSLITASEEFPRGRPRKPKRSCLLIECDETRTPQCNLEFSNLDRLFCLGLCGGRRL